MVIRRAKQGIEWFHKFESCMLVGAELQDADGNMMSQAEATAFIQTLP